MTQKQLYILISTIVIIGIIAAVFILTSNQEPTGPKQEETAEQTQQPPQITPTSTPVTIIKSQPLSDKPLPEEKPEEIKKQIEEEKKEEQKIIEKKKKNPLLPEYPVFNAKGKILEIKENGFVMETEYGKYNVVFIQNTMTFENENDTVPTNGKAGLYLLKLNQTVAISTLNALNDNEMVTAATVKIVK